MVTLSLIAVIACWAARCFADEQLFAILGANSCAESLYYGPQLLTTSGTADGLHSRYFSTNTASKEVPHDTWLQIVTSDGVNEIFRIYWTFVIQRTLAQRFVAAVNTGEGVSYRVVDAATHQEYSYYGTWRFSSGALVSASKFNVATSTCCFSADDGAWGAGSGVINANGDLYGYVAPSFWGIGNWESTQDSGCYFVYKNGVQLNTYGNNAVTYMYYDAELPPSAEPTAAPTNPSVAPTTLLTPSPSTSPSARPLPAGQQLLFAVVGGQSCAENLYYGPQAITTAGSADGLRPYFLSTSKNVAHTQWLQIVTSDGTTELFRIYWTFSTARTVEGHFTTAVSQGVAVSFVVYDASSSLEYSYSGTWWFSNSAAITSSKFAVATTQYGFSADDGIWGAFNGVGNPNGVPSGYASAKFWGVGNWDSSDSSECSKVYKNGVLYNNYGTGVKSYMYYFDPVSPTQMPTVAPTRPTPLPSASSAPTVVPTTRPPTQAPSRSPTVEATPYPTYNRSTEVRHLFAVLGGSACAENLIYGPQPITSAGSADGYGTYLSTRTPGYDTPHDTWEQVVTSDGTTELFRITWRFSSMKTLAQRISNAVVAGEPVAYTVTEAGGQVHTYNGIWWFSNGAGSMPAKFETTFSTCCFSADDGTWGAGSGVVQPNGNANSVGTVSFWGIGNWDATDSDCAKIYRQGSWTQGGAAARTYMYYFAPAVPTSEPTVKPTLAPTAAPTPRPTLVPTAKPTMDPALMPTARPTADSTVKPTSSPTADPTVKPTSAAPTRVPTGAPTPKPTLVTAPPTIIPTQTAAPTLRGQNLFAVVGGTQCAEALPYGPQAITRGGSWDLTRPYFFSTVTESKYVPHTQWLQIVTSDGITELFRVYWTFSTPRTLAEHFVTAVAQGVAVSYRVVTAAGAEYAYAGTWRFSDGSGIQASTFETMYINNAFSADDGVWGAGNGVLNGNGNSFAYSAAKFWGVGTWDSGDSTDCYKIFMDGVPYASYGYNTKTYMYYTTLTDPTAEPTTAPSGPSYAPTLSPSSAPTVRPTSLAPTPVPSRAPTPRATFAPNAGPDQLFAVVGGQNCAEQLAYGPQVITPAGSGDGAYPYFLSTITPARNIPHQHWTQIVTSDGTTELFRIYWTFDTPRTLADHIVTATVQGVAVSYRVETPSGGVYTLAGTWWFTNAQITAAQFNTSTTKIGFSLDDGAWGAGSGVIQANGGAYNSIHFWGVGNWNSADSTECYKVYMDGSVYTSYGISTKTYMYYTINTDPTVTPTADPTGPTRAPTTAVTPSPSCAPTRPPTGRPTTRPTNTPTVKPTFPVFTGGEALFAVVGGAACAENLYYGPQAITTTGSADGLHPYFLSTATAARDTPHQHWTQIVTSDGATELFRIYWTFDTPRTLADHIITATTQGVAVSYRVETPTGGVYTYAGTWWFSNGAQVTSAKFSTAAVVLGFSADDGAWGAGSGVIQANGNTGAYSLAHFWGVGNWDSADNTECYKIYMDGVVSTSYGANTRTYMYYSTSTDPTAAPTVTPSTPTLPTTAPPTWKPSCVPTSAPPTRYPTPRPTNAATVRPPVPVFTGGDTLFAVVGGDACAENLYYGPQAITAAGSADGLHPYFLSTVTAGRGSVHQYWTQIVTSDGTTELFRIYWTFDTPRTLAEHFITATTQGVAVDYRVETPTGYVYTYTGTWWFSDVAHVTSAKFATTVTSVGFSADDGVWGAGSGTIQPNGNINGYFSSTFWGVGNWDSADNMDCFKIYMEGAAYTGYGYNTKTYMYYSGVPASSASPTRAPSRTPAGASSALPTAPAPVVQMDVVQVSVACASFAPLVRVLLLPHAYFYLCSLRSNYKAPATTTTY
jgi:hypothetical protein